MSWIIFDDIFFIYDPDQAILSSHPYSLLQQDLRHPDSKKINLIVDTPFQLVPEEGYEESGNSLILHTVQPLIPIQNSQIKVDTWSGSYARCVYYIPRELQHLNAANYMHWMSGIERFSRGFFKEVHTGLVSIRVYDTLYVLIQVRKVLKEAVRLQVPSPDDSSFHLLKWVEKYRAHQSDFILWTNESSPSHVRILKKYLSEVRILKGEKENIIPEIIQGI